MPKKIREKQMAKDAARESINEWLGTAFKACVFVVFTMFTAFVSQLNDSIGSLTAQLKNLEVKMVDTDKRVNAIEVARGINSERFEKLMSDVEQMKLRLTEQGMRIQTIAEFVAAKKK